nr:winged helix-turn-helix domain-containing protein [uncultured Roseateles sp.]
MTRPPPSAAPLLFGPFKLDLAAAQLLRDGQVLPLRPKAYELLVALACRPGELVTKDELLDTVWGRRFITEGVIKAVVAELRGVLGDDPKAPRWITTVPRRGYRFAEAGVDSAPSPAQPAVAAGSGNVPLGLEPVIGRETELAALSVLLADHRLLTLAGPSGIGKTRLAWALADLQSQGRSWSDGVWFVELAALLPESCDAGLLCATIAQTLQLGAGASGDVAALARALQPLKLLLLLDNAEHLLPQLAPLLAALLPQAPTLRIVLTSQEPLRIPGEQLFRLEPLSLPPVADDGDRQRLMGSSAVRLFVQRVAARMPGFALAAQQQRAVADICRALDGLPLALELAAARVPLLGVHGIADLLLGDEDGARLALLNQGARNAVPRQRSLRDALQWSHALLDETQRRVLRRLAVFRGGFNLGSAQLVCSDQPLDLGQGGALEDWGVLDALHALVDKSLLAPASEPGALPRFKLLESVRAFALELLGQSGEWPATQARHWRAMCVYWAQADARALSDPSLDWMTRHLPELDNLRVALRWACTEPAPTGAGLRLLGHTALLWHRAGFAAEGRGWCEQLREQALGTADASLRGGFELVVAALSSYASAYPPAEGAAAARHAVQVFEAGADAVRAYFSLYLLNQLTQSQPRTEGEDLLARMGHWEQSGWSELLTRYGRMARGYRSRLAGRSEDYLAFCRSEFARCRRLGARAESWGAAQGLMLAEHDVGAVGEALQVGRETLAEIRGAGQLRQHLALLAVWTTMLAQSGNTAGTRAALSEGLPALSGAGTAWMAHVALAWLAAHEGRHDDAGRLLGWHDAAQLQHSRPAAGGYIARSLQALDQHLEQRLGGAALQHLRAAGTHLGDEGAQRLALRPGT